jgi:2,3-bisphosphoglycerate-dependent phosphoglycerate mutase
MKTILLVARHGNTFAPGDVVTRVGARTDLPLVASGLEQGRKLGLYLRDNDLLPSAVFTSELKRARQTAEQALSAAGIAPPVRIDPLFNEIDYGVDENRPEAEVVARLGADALKDWDVDAVAPDGWRVDAQAIVQGWLDFGAKLARDYEGKTILVVTSNGIARFAPCLTDDFAAFRHDHTLKLSTGALCVFSHQAERWRVDGWNIRP